MKNDSRKTKKRGIGNRKSIGYFPRRIARSIAKANMRHEGAQRINRSFAKNWKKWVR